MMTLETRPGELDVCDFLNANLGLKEIVRAILIEYLDACDAYPVWPTDVVHTASIVAEEAGELLKEANDIRWKEDTIERRENLLTEAIQTGAMAVRFLENIGNLKGGA